MMLAVSNFLLMAMLLGQAQYADFRSLSREGYFFDPTADVIAVIPSGGVVFTLTGPAASISIWQSLPSAGGYTRILASIEPPCVSSFEIDDDGNRMRFTCDRSDELGKDYVHMFFERGDKDSQFTLSGCDFSTAHLDGSPTKQSQKNVGEECM